MISQTRETYFEQCWNKAQPGTTLIQRRVEHFDPISELIYAPIEYVLRSIENVEDKLPKEEWVMNNFSTFVRGEFGTSAPQDCPPTLPEWECETTNIDIIMQYLEQCENELYGGYIDAITRDKKSGMPENIFIILTDSLLGNRKNRKYLKKEDFASSISPLIRDQLRLMFVIPSFPFKDQCIFRANAPPSHVDLGEIALLIRLHTLALALYQVHPYGADWIIASDGRAYADTLRVSIQEVEKYFHKLQMYRNILNLQGTVSIIDLKEMTRRLVSKKAGEYVFEYTVEEIERILRKRLIPENSKKHQEFRVLVRGMKKNTNLKDVLDTLSWNDQWSILCTDSKEAISPSLREIWQAVDEIVVESSLNYAAFNIAMRYHSVYQKVLPATIRATIHAKPNQIAVPRIGDVYPWNGVGVLYYKDKKFFIETWELSQIIRNFEVTPFRLHDENAPFYYRIDKKRT